MSRKLNDCSQKNCDDALKELGKLSHSIQDYYGHGASNIPSANGQVKYNGNSETRPNPKALAENMAKNGGMPAKIPPENNQ